METKTQTTESTPEEEPQPQPIVTPIPTASISLSLSTILPNATHWFTHQKLLLLTNPSKVKIPNQAFSLTHLSLSSTTSPLKTTPLSSKNSTTLLSSTPLFSPLRPSSPSSSSSAALRRSSLCWFRNDLRLHDNESLSSANSDSLSLLPVYCFDPRDYGKSPSGFDKTGPFRASFVIESVSDLRTNLRSRGSDLVVRVGPPETVLVELARAVGAEAVYVHKEVSHDEVRAEERVEAAMKEEGIEVKYFWGSTLYHLDDLPFKLEDMPSNYGGFRDRVKGLEVRNTIQALDNFKGLPCGGDVEPGEIPTLLDLGLSCPNSQVVQDGKATANAAMVGGETEALGRLQKFVAECQAQPPKGGSHDSIYGANFSCKISPWLTMGCISPRFMFDELKKTTTRTIPSSSNCKNGGNGSPDTGLNWLMFELLWRDFFRFITKKYSSPKKQLDAAPVAACTPAFA